jgi:hypothetical protein
MQQKMATSEAKSGKAQDALLPQAGCISRLSVAANSRGRTVQTECHGITTKRQWKQLATAPRLRIAAGPLATTDAAKGATL